MQLVQAFMIFCLRLSYTGVTRGKNSFGIHDELDYHVLSTTNWFTQLSVELNEGETKKIL